MARRRLTALLLGVATLLEGTSATAGGFDEIPAQGAQAIGRGGAFTAKADDGTALFYNVAGLAQQRGTKLLVSTNVTLDSYTFARAGNYPDDPNNPATPWGGRPFPVVSNAAGPSPLPMLAFTTDLGLDRLTFATGVLVPSAVGRMFQLGAGGLPSPARYAAAGAGGSLIAYPTLAAAYRLTDAIDVGVAGHLVVADLQSPLAIAYVDPGGGVCKSQEYYGCDAQAAYKLSGMGVAASAGVLAHLTRSLELGMQVKTPWTVKADGTHTAKLPGGATVPPSPMTVNISFPLNARLGARYIGLRDAFEAYDVELDMAYEPWSSTGPGPIVMSTTDPTTNKPMNMAMMQGYKDTYDLHLGGAYNVDLEGDVLSLRAGGFYLTPTTDGPYTSAGANTLPKLAGTLGVGYAWGAVSVNAAYAGVASISRTVTDGEIRPANLAKGGASIDGDGKPLGATNNGVYSGFTHLFSLSVEVSFAKIFGGEPKPARGDRPPEDVDARAKSLTAKAAPKTGDPPTPSSATTSATENPEPPTPYFVVPDSDLEPAAASPPPKAPRRGRPNRAAAPRKHRAARPASSTE
jgi:long-chain fatty acid transport protein